MTGRSHDVALGIAGGFGSRAPQGRIGGYEDRESGPMPFGRWKAHAAGARIRLRLRSSAFAAALIPAVVPDRIRHQGWWHDRRVTHRVARRAGPGRCGAGGPHDVRGPMLVAPLCADRAVDRRYQAGPGAAARDAPCGGPARIHRRLGRRARRSASASARGSAAVSTRSRPGHAGDRRRYHDHRRVPARGFMSSGSCRSW